MKYELSSRFHVQWLMLRRGPSFDPMQCRYVGDIGDSLKLAILRALSPGHLFGVIWWLYPDENHNSDGRHVGYLDQPDRWRHYDPQLFDGLRKIVGSGQRHVRALEATDLLSGAILTNDLIPIPGSIGARRHAREKWFETVFQKVEQAHLVFLDPDNGLEPDGFRHGSSKAGKSVTLAELQALTRPGRWLIVYHHHTRRAGGRHNEIGYWADRLRNYGLANRVDVLRAKRYSPRAFFLLDAPDDVPQRAEFIANRWKGFIDWHPDPGSKEAVKGAGLPTTAQEPGKQASGRSGPAGRSRTTQPGYVNRNGQEVLRPTDKLGTDHGQYVYVLRCWACGHEYGANGSDIWLRRCPNHDRGAPGLAI